MVVVITFVLEYRCVTEDGETMREAAGNKELEVIVFSQFDCYMLAVSGGAFADINCHIKDCSLYAAHELSLSEWWALEMQPSHNTKSGARFVVLDEIHWVDFGIEDFFIVAFEEAASGVFEDAGLDNY